MLVFGGAATAYLLADQLAWDVDGRWVLPIALIVLGVAGIAGAVGGLRPTRTDSAIRCGVRRCSRSAAEQDLVADASRTS